VALEFLDLGEELLIDFGHFLFKQSMSAASKAPTRRHTSASVSIRQHTCQHTHLFKEGDGGGRADARHDVLALSVEQKFAVELILTGRRVARKEYAGA
jgi:hypothetical protein